MVPARAGKPCTLIGWRVRTLRFHWLCEEPRTARAALALDVTAMHRPPGISLGNKRLSEWAPRLAPRFDLSRERDSLWAVIADRVSRSSRVASARRLAVLLICPPAFLGHGLTF